MKGRRVLVTGGAGFIGSALARHLVGAAGAEVLVVDKLTYAGNLASLAPIAREARFRFEKADIGDRPAIAALLAAFRPGIVFNLAAESHVDRSIDGPAAFVQTNIVGTSVLLDASLEYWRGLPAEERAGFRFHHISTDEVFGELGRDGSFNEVTAYRPNSPYAASKASADHLVRAWHRTYGLPAVISNCSNNYGPYQFPEKLIPLTIINALEGRPLPVYGKGANIRDWLYVDDHIDALVAIATAGTPGESYCVGGGAERTNVDVVRAICAGLDRLRPHASGPRERLITFVPDRPGHDFRYAIDPSRVATDFGWRPRRSFDAGLEETIRWYLDRRDWWQPIREGTYRGERLGASA